VQACKGAALCMPYNSSTHAMEAQRLPVDVLKHACNLRNTQAYVGSLVQTTFLHKLEKERLGKQAQGADEGTRRRIVCGSPGVLACIRSLLVHCARCASRRAQILNAGCGFAAGNGNPRSARGLGARALLGAGCGLHLLPWCVLCERLLHHWASLACGSRCRVSCAARPASRVECASILIIRSCLAAHPGKCQGHSAVRARPQAGGYTMGNTRPAVIVRALASLATPPAGRARIRCRLLKLVISEATFAAPWHGRA